jgi:hypothetical protein
MHWKRALSINLEAIQHDSNFKIKEGEETYCARNLGGSLQIYFVGPNTKRLFDS